MGSIFGHLKISDSDRLYTLTTGQQVVYDTARAYIAAANAKLNLALSKFVETTTDKFTERYKLPGNGSLQRRSNNGRYGSVKTTGHWDVAFPIEDFGAQLSGNDVEMSYMTIGDLEMHIQTVIAQNINTVRFEMLKALLNKANYTFSDPLHGDLTIRRLANTDGSLYPPIVGAEDPTESEHYIGLNYTVISDADNPFVTGRNLLEDHFGQTNMEIVAFINRAQQATTEALTGFVPVNKRTIVKGITADQVVAIPDVPGTIIGSTKDGTWVSVYPHMPAGYIYEQALGVAAPLKRRIDPADTGLGDGLQLVAREKEFPFEATYWRHRFGFGVGNRLNGVAMQLIASTTYTTPTDFA